MNRLEKFWSREAQQHSKDLVSDLQLYYRGYMPIEQVEQTLRKLFSDIALLTVENIKTMRNGCNLKVPMEDVKELIANLKITVPKKYIKFGVAEK